MLAGRAVVAIWNGLAPAAHAAFYDWHTNEHMPERVGIPGFCRGRRYVAAGPDTHPEFFTLYETADFAVVTGPGYRARLDDPTEGTRANTQQFRDTARALAHVRESSGPGAGGTMLTVRFDAPAPALEPIALLVRQAGAAPRVCGAHLCVADQTASLVRTGETRDRTDIEAPPTWFAMLEGTDADALAGLLPAAALTAAGATGPFHRGLYRLEYVRDATPGLGP